MNREQRRAQARNPLGVSVEPVPPEAFSKSLVSTRSDPATGKQAGLQNVTHADMMRDYAGDEKMARAAGARIIMLSKAMNEGLSERIATAEKETGLEGLAAFIDEVGAIAPCTTRDGYDLAALIGLLVQRTQAAADAKAGGAVR